MVAPTHRLSSQRKLGPIHQLVQVVSWIPAFAGMARVWGAVWWQVRR